MTTLTLALESFHGQPACCPDTASGLIWPPLQQCYLIMVGFRPGISWATPGFFLDSHCDPFLLYCSVITILSYAKRPGVLFLLCLVSFFPICWLGGSISAYFRAAANFLDIGSGLSGVFSLSIPSFLFSCYLRERLCMGIQNLCSGQLQRYGATEEWHLGFLFPVGEDIDFILLF
jgi:hypothetical protein